MFGLEALGAAASGGITGLLGGLVNVVGDYFKARENNRHDEAMADKDITITELESKRDVSVAKLEAEAEETKQDAQLMAKSYEADKRRYLSKSGMKDRGWVSSLVVFLMGFVDFVRGMTRPVLTGYMCYVTTLIYFKTQEVTGSHINEETAGELMRVVTVGMVYLTMTAVGWWFGSRSKVQLPGPRGKRTGSLSLPSPFGDSK